MSIEQLIETHIPEEQLESLFSDVSEDKIRWLKRKYKDEMKNIKKGKQRKLFDIGIEDIDKFINFIELQDRYVWDRMEYEKKRASDFLYNEEEARKAGWYNKKEAKDNSKLIEWADKAYPDYNIDLFNVEFVYYNIDRLIK